MRLLRFLTVILTALFFSFYLDKSVAIAHEGEKHEASEIVSSYFEDKVGDQYSTFGVVIRKDLEEGIIEIDTRRGFMTLPVAKKAHRILKRVNSHKGVDLRVVKKDGNLIVDGIIRRGEFNCECEYLLKRFKSKDLRKLTESLNSPL